MNSNRNEALKLRDALIDLKCGLSRLESGTSMINSCEASEGFNIDRTWKDIDAVLAGGIATEGWQSAFKWVAESLGPIEKLYREAIETLKIIPDEWVQKSDHPQLNERWKSALRRVLKQCERWAGASSQFNRNSTYARHELMSIAQDAISTGKGVREAAESLVVWIEATADLSADVALFENQQSIGNTEKRTQPPKKSPKGKPKATVNARMLEIMSDDPEVRGWTAQQWAKKLKCGRSTVVETKTWQDLELVREKQKAERAKDRRHKTKGS